MSGTTAPGPAATAGTAPGAPGPPAPPAPADADCVRVRMYNAGFGDAFLLTFPVDDAERPFRKVLIDCGTREAVAGLPTMDEIVERIIADAAQGERGGPRIDVVVATHRHLDHVKGFEHRAWKGVQVGQVWMPWTEDPKDPEARRVWGVQTAAVRLLLAALQRKASALRGEPAREAAAFAGMMENSLPNPDAMRTLYSGFAGSPQRVYLPRRRRNETAEQARAARSFEASMLGNVVVHVLGPDRDPDIFRAVHREAEEFLTAATPDAADALAATDRPRPPFGARWVVDAAAFAAHYPRLTPDESDLAHLRNIDLDSDLEAAADADRAVNNTSLMLIFEINRTTRLLFSGDAEWRTWRRVLADAAWQTLLRGVTFYKVGHHASRNATPRTFVEQYLDKDAADPWVMVPTHRLPSRPTWDVPREKLVKKLAEKTKRLARADKLSEAPPEWFSTDGRLYVEAKIPLSR